MMSLLAIWLVSTISLLIISKLPLGIHIDEFGTALTAAAVLGILNAVLKPILTLLSLPIVFLSLGLFLLVINAIILKLTSFLVSGFEVGGLWSAIGGALIISIINLLIGKNDKRKSKVSIKTNRNPAPHPSKPKPPEGKGPVIDI